jgi:hypothetical protein
MLLERGYCGSSFGASGFLYVVGGQASVGGPLVLNSVECFDIKTNKWQLFRGSEDEGIPRVDLTVVYTPFTE